MAVGETAVFLVGGHLFKNENDLLESKNKNMDGVLIREGKTWILD